MPVSFPAQTACLHFTTTASQANLTEVEARFGRDKFELELKGIEREVGLQHEIAELREELERKVRLLLLRGRLHTSVIVLECANDAH
jgi:hypothetical protein